MTESISGALAAEDQQSRQTEARQGNRRWFGNNGIANAIIPGAIVHGAGTGVIVNERLDDARSATDNRLPQGVLP
jgi:hypothetical protein